MTETFNSEGIGFQFSPHRVDLSGSLQPDAGVFTIDIAPSVAGDATTADTYEDSLACVEESA